MTEIVFGEIPGGSRNKYEFDPALGGIVLDRRLFTAMSYPADYGINDVADIGSELRREIEHFFQRYKEFEEKETVVGGFGNRDEALALIAERRDRARGRVWARGVACGRSLRRRRYCVVDVFEASVRRRRCVRGRRAIAAIVNPSRPRRPPAV